MVILCGAHISEEPTIELQTIGTRLRGWYDYHDEPDETLPGYEAISYAWGDPKPTKRVRCCAGAAFENDQTSSNGQESLQSDACRSMAVSDTMYNILQDLRPDNRNRTIRIDALSIDQNDHVEKGEQVAIMGEIYQHARRVIVCIPASPTDGATWVHHAAERSKPDRRKVGHYGILGPPICDMTLAKSEIQALEFSLLKPCFTRTWVLQEVTVPDEVVVRYGDGTIEWNSLSLACSAVREKDSPSLFEMAKNIEDIYTLRISNRLLGEKAHFDSS